jgi:hypothetical protein
MKTLNTIIALVVFTFGVSAFAQENVYDWTNKAGKTIRAKFISVDDEAVTIFANGRNYVVKLADTGEKSAELAKKLGEATAKKGEAADSAELIKIYNQLRVEKAKNELAGQGSKGPLPDHLLGIWAPDVEASMKLLMKPPLGLEGKEEFGEQFLLLMRNYYATMRVTKTRIHMTTFYNMGGRKATVRVPYHVLSKEENTYRVSFKCNYYSSQLKRNVRGDSISLLKVLPDGRVSSAFRLRASLLRGRARDAQQHHFQENQMTGNPKAYTSSPPSTWLPVAQYSFFDANKPRAMSGLDDEHGTAPFSCVYFLTIQEAVSFSYWSGSNLLLG